MLAMVVAVISTFFGGVPVSGDSSEAMSLTSRWLINQVLDDEDFGRLDNGDKRVLLAAVQDCDECYAELRELVESSESGDRAVAILAQFDRAETIPWALHELSVGDLPDDVSQRLKKVVLRVSCLFDDGFVPEVGPPPSLEQVAAVANAHPYWKDQDPIVRELCRRSINDIAEWKASGRREFDSANLEWLLEVDRQGQSVGIAMDWLSSASTATAEDRYQIGLVLRKIMWHTGPVVEMAWSVPDDVARTELERQRQSMVQWWKAHGKGDGSTTQWRLASLGLADTMRSPDRALEELTSMLMLPDDPLRNFTAARVLGDVLGPSIGEIAIARPHPELSWPQSRRVPTPLRLLAAAQVATWRLEHARMNVMWEDASLCYSVQDE